MKQETIKLWTIFLALVLFFAFGMLAIEFMRTPPQVQKTTHEPFTTAPTKPSECRCLPGYVPSNTLEGTKHGGSVIRYRNATYFVPINTKDMYFIPRCSMCDVNFCNKDVYVDVTDAQFKTYTSKGEFNCKVMERGKEEQQLQTYFCQKLGEPLEKQPCY